MTVNICMELNACDCMYAKYKCMYDIYVRLCMITIDSVCLSLSLSVCVCLFVMCTKLPGVRLSAPERLRMESRTSSTCRGSVPWDITRVESLWKCRGNTDIALPYNAFI